MNRVIVIIAAGLWGAGCGLKGNLYLETDAPPANAGSTISSTQDAGETTADRDNEAEPSSQ